MRQETTAIDPEPAEGAPSVMCHVQDPVILYAPLHGVDLIDHYDPAAVGVVGACNMILSLANTIDDVASLGVVRVTHMGTYSCRVIAGTTSLSRHAYGDAIDLAEFEFDDGTVYTLVDHWEHDTSSPATPGGQFLYEAAHRWFDNYYWNIVLTPNYNAAHDDHFHVDLTPASHFLGFHGGARYIGPAPYAD